MKQSVCLFILFLSSNLLFFSCSSQPCSSNSDCPNATKCSKRGQCIPDLILVQTNESQQEANPEALVKKEAGEENSQTSESKERDGERSDFYDKISDGGEPKDQPITNEPKIQEELCSEGAEKPCFRGTTKQINVGICKQGKRICTKGVWSRCIGDIRPIAEVCDGLDNDCDGEIDNGITCQCQSGKTRACGQHTGTCKQGTQTCKNNQWSDCSGEIKPVTELCDGKDNDCDGSIDEDFPTKGNTCTTGSGECQSQGNLTCSSNKQALTCDVVAKQVSTTEVCDGKDNDCDGQTDENLTQACGSDVGECQKGTQTCSAGNWGPCAGEVAPKSEACDNKDNDCNGKIDDDSSCDKGECTNGSSKACYTGNKQTLNVGLCQAGTMHCNNKKWGKCTNETVPTTEVCGDNKDNDCDGSIDENCSTTAKEFEDCSTKQCPLWHQCFSLGTGHVPVCLKHCSSTCANGLSCVSFTNGTSFCMKRSCTKDSDCPQTPTKHYCNFDIFSKPTCIPAQKSGPKDFGERCDIYVSSKRCKSGLTCIEGDTESICAKSCSNSRSCSGLSSSATCVHFKRKKSKETLGYYCLKTCTNHSQCPGTTLCSSSSSSSKKYCY